MQLITIRPGPVLHVWENGKAVIEVPLSPVAALSLLRDLADALSSGDFVLHSESLLHKEKG